MLAPALSKPDANADPAAAAAAAAAAPAATAAAAAASSSGHSLAQFPAFAKLAAATEYHDAAVLTVLNLSFLGDMLADALSASQSVVSFNGRMFHQYLYGIIAIFVAVIIVGLYLSYRYYQVRGGVRGRERER